MMIQIGVVVGISLFFMMMLLTLEDRLTMMFQAEAKCFVDLIKHGESDVAPTPQEGIDALQVVLASQESCRINKPIML